MTGFLVVSIAIVAWLTAAATAVRSVSRIWLRHWVEQRLRGAITAELYLERPHRMLLAATTGVSLTVFAAGAYIGSGSTTGSVLRQSMVLSLVLLVVGQLVPRAIARRWASRLIPVLLPPVRALDIVLTPLLALVRQVTGERRATANREATEGDDDAIDEVLREGEIEGVGERAEIAIISSVVDFGARKLVDAMTPRADIFAVDVTLAADEIVRQVAQSGFSRVPVYRGDLDHMEGMIHAFDMLQHEGALPEELRPVAVSPASARCSDMLFHMLRERNHLAIVTDERGATVGLVTLEDLLEELVGEIRDEHDEPGGVDLPRPGAGH
ncbi:MAG: CNNM domain-containing protein [Gemmatimonadaceae bacterium]